MQTKALSAAKPLFYFVLIYLFCFLLKSPSHALLHFKDALTLCGTRLIPTLFPFMVLNELMISSGLATYLGRLFGAPFAKLFNTEKEGCAAFVSGLLFGFPLGVKSAVSLYEKGYISKKQTEKIICFCANCGPAFSIGVVGALLQNKKAAILIYVCQIISAVTVGLFIKEKNKKTSPSLKPRREDGFDFSLSKAISSSVKPMMNVCAFVCFFACISCSAEAITSFLGLPDHIALFFTGFLEISSGTALAPVILPPTYATAFCAFFVGWSGLSVILQSIGLCAPYGISCKAFVVSKLLQGFLCALLCCFFCKLLKMY